MSRVTEKDKFVIVCGSVEVESAAMAEVVRNDRYTNTGKGTEGKYCEADGKTWVIEIWKVWAVTDRS